MSQPPFDWSLLSALTGQPQTKQALTPPADPSAGGAGGGAPPMDPGMMGGTPGGAATMPGMPPAQLPPMDPAAQAGGMMPGMDPSMMGAGGMPPGGGDPSLAMGGQPAAGGPPGGAKLKPEQMFQIISLRLFNIEQQLAEALRQQGKSLDPGAMIQPQDATMAGAPKPDGSGGDPSADPSQQDPGQAKAAAYLTALRDARLVLQHQAPEGYDVHLVRRIDDPVKEAASRTQRIADDLLPKLAGLDGDEADVAFENEYQQNLLLEFGAKAASDFLSQNPVQQIEDDGALAEEFRDTLLGHPAIAPEGSPLNSMASPGASSDAPLAAMLGL